MNIYSRGLYYSRISPFIGKNLIKVITGQRRVGKSYFLQDIRKKLESGNKPVDTLYINKEDLSFDAIRNYSDLVKWVEERVPGKGKTALLIDEVQEISSFEKALRHFYASERFDIYCTGSSATLLSGELATLLGGRTISLEIYPLTYPEFLQFHHLKENEKSFEKYLFFGGMPGLIHLPPEEDVVYDYLRNIHSTILIKDVITRHAIRNVSFLQNLVLYLAENTGNLVSAKRISDFLRSQNIRISSLLVQDYLQFLSEAGFIHKVRRSDLKGKRIFEIGEKYYFNDIGIRNALTGYRAADISKLLENIVFIHLRAAGYQVTVGKDRTKEVDFVASKQGELLYIQVCYMLNSEKTVEREFGNLARIRNDYPKIVVSLDISSKVSFEGIRHFHIRDFCTKIIKNQL